MNFHGFNEYGYDEALHFNALSPKVMELVGEENTVGKLEGNEEVVSVFDTEAKGNQQLVVVSSQEIANSESEGDEPEAEEKGE